MSEDEKFYDALEDIPPRHFNSNRQRSSLHPLSGLVSPRRSLATTEDASTQSIDGARSEQAEQSIICDEKRLIKAAVKPHEKAGVIFKDLYIIQELKDTDPLFIEPPSRSSSCTEALPECQTSKSFITVDNADTGGSSGAIYALAFSRDGHYLAAGGQDKTVRIWKLVVQSILDDPNVDTRQAPIFQDKALRLVGHEADILDLSWSRPSSNFLLSSSMDRSVRLWHPSRSVCLAVFRHLDFVTGVAFHPRDDRFFLSGSLDRRLRLWSIESRKVLSWHELGPGNLITAVSFNSNGKVAIAGTSNAQLVFFDCTKGLQYHSQIAVCSRRGKNRLGSKISGIEAMVGKFGDERILVTSNDSRLRMYTLRDKGLFCKYAGGFTNATSQIRGSFSEEGDYIVTASEDGSVCLHESVTTKRKSFFGSNERISAYEQFTAFHMPCTVACFAPTCVRNLLISCLMRPSATLCGSPDDETFASGQILAAADMSGRIRVWENNARLPAWLDRRSASWDNLLDAS